MKKNKKGISKVFETFSAKVTKVTGSSSAFFIAFAIILVWGITGPLFGFSDTWQLVINTGTTIITFLMVFVIQQSQNKDTMAVQMKLNELIGSTKGASNRLIDVEDLTSEELEIIKKFYIKLAKLAKEESDINCTHSYEEAEELHQRKVERKE